MPSPRSSLRAQRAKQQNMTLMAIAITFVLLVLVVTILLCINVVMDIRDRADRPQDDPSQNPSGDQTPSGNESGDPGTDPDGDQTLSPGDDTQTPPISRTEAISAEQINQGALILVNTTHKYVFPDHALRLVNIYDRQASAKTLSQYFQLASDQLWMDQDAYLQMDKLLRAFGDPSVVLTGAYRTAEQQTASGSSVPAGYSDSHTGLSCALRGQPGTGLGETKYAWLYENAYKYGFIVRYPEDKAALTGVSDYTNYFRYVGYVHAYIMKTNNFCLEEYIPYLQRHTYGETALQVTTDDGSSYEIYYVAATGDVTTVPVPDTGNYTISGDNEGGFIITVKCS